LRYVAWGESQLVLYQVIQDKYLVFEMRMLMLLTVAWLRQLGRVGLPQSEANLVGATTGTQTGIHVPGLLSVAI